MSAHISAPPEPCEGELYKSISVAGHSFTIRYGYYADLDRENGEPMPIFPDFLQTPLYTAEGYPYCTRIQDACPHYSPKRGKDDGWCADCAFYPDTMEEIGVCRCDRRKNAKAGTAQREGGIGI